MADGAAGQCLSDLSDDLLRHILFLAPDREGASTAVLSRRWRWLWRTLGAVFIDSRSFTGGCSSPDQEREGFLSSAEKALAAAAAATPSHIRRLTLFIDEDRNKNLTHHHRVMYGSEESNMIEALVSNPAARRVEELYLIVVPRFMLSFGSLPSEALRVLHLKGYCNCYYLTAPPTGAAEFPMLAELYLRHCDVSLVDFRKIINAAPRLSTLHLESTTLGIKKDTVHDDDDDHDDDEMYTIDDDEQLFGRLLIPAVTDLEVADCDYGYKASLELEVPRLQYFRYRAHVQQINRLSLKPRTSSHMIQVDLDLTSHYQGYNECRTQTSHSFQQFMNNINNTKLLKLKLDFTKDDLALALDCMAGWDELFGGMSFYHLEQLELESEYMPEFERTLLMMLADLLHSCPMVRDLRLRLRKQHEMPWVDSSIDKEARMHFDRSANGFRNRRTPNVSLGGEHDHNNYQAYGIVSCLTGEHSLSCLQSHLKRLSLQFLMDEPNCLGVQLAKFFAENAMVLQEIHIDDGCHEMLEHVNPTVRRWIAETDKCNKQLIVKD